MGSNFVLHDEELHPNVQHFEVEQPLTGLKQDKQRLQRLHRPTVDVFAGEDKEILSFEGFTSPWYKQLLFLVLGVCTFGVLFLVAKWSLRVRTALRLSRCPLKQAKFVRVTLLDGRVSLHDVEVLQPSPAASHPYLSPQQHPDLLVEAGFPLQQRLLEYRCGRYFYVESADKFLPVPDVPKAFNTQLQASATRMAVSKDPRVLEEHDWQLGDRQQHYGSNEMAIPVKSVAALIADEMWHPFYVFQYFSIIIWVAGDQYYTYAVCILVITWFSIITSAVETHQNMKRLADIAHFSCMVEVLRGGSFKLMPSQTLVPGDIIAVVPGTLPADCVLLNGECIVDENMLTGESVPVRKVPYNPSVEGSGYCPDKHSSCTLYGGTQVAQARAPGTSYSGLGLSPSASTGGCALAMVARTRFYSAKGQLLRSILYPRDGSESFISDSLKFIGVMLVACIGIFIWAAVVLASIGAEPTRIVVRFFDMITIAVPPALPACLTIATVFSIGRLRKIGIYVTGPHTITLAGQLDVVCFDKTGTLTVQGLELQSIVPVNNGRFEPPSTDMQLLPPDVPQLLASCHGLALLGDTLVGDPLDQKLFAATQSLAAAVPGATHVLYAKGSPEMIKSLVAASSLPPDFDRLLAEYTREGLRVLALARGVVVPGSLPDGALSSYSQQQLEAAVQLELTGLAVLANPLRPDTAGAIQALQKAQIRTAMVTGDHVRTAVSVAHQCNILPEGRPVLLMDAAPPGQPVDACPVSLSVLYPDGSVNASVTRTAVLPQVMMGELECAVTGKGFDALLAPPFDAELLQPMLRRGTVFARMSPDNKRDLMELLGSGLQTAAAPGCPKLGLHVGFCGDGANDCGALKAAHVGVSLCEAEASVAAPMTSRQQSITSMISVVAEGRCALLATYQIFQFIVGYAMAQAFATNLMYTHGLQMGNYQYLIQDLFYITILAALMGYTKPRKELARAKPVGRVLSLPLILSLLLQIAVVIVFQLIALRAMRRIPWYKSTIGTPDLRTYKAPETTVIYLINLAQFIILGVVFNKGYPHRQPLWTNVGMLVAMILQVMFLIYSLFSVDAFTTKVQTMVGRGPPDGLPTAFRAGLLLIMVVNAAVALLAELGSTYGLRLIDRAKSSGWLQRRRSTTDPVLRQGLLHPMHIGMPLPKHSPANGLHVPSLQPPSGAALL
ncbi:hypothetical protein OEZ86_011166 [Tetradesmus obliquus]|nr:hypothetical protein OEZ86_011166 [Tetradesmus obliquus]